MGKINKIILGPIVATSLAIQGVGAEKVKNDTNAQIQDLVTQCDLNKDGKVLGIKERLCQKKIEVAQLDQGIAQGKENIAQLDQGIAQGKERIAQLDQGIAQGKENIAQLDQRGKQLDQKIAKLKQEIRENITSKAP